MPCLGPGETIKEMINGEKIIENANKYVTYLEIKKLEGLLCSTCRVLSRLGYDFDENPRLSEWWHKHQIEDQEKSG